MEEPTYIYSAHFFNGKGAVKPRIKTREMDKVYAKYHPTSNKLPKLLTLQFLEKRWLCMSESTIEAVIERLKVDTWLRHCVTSNEITHEVTSGANILSYLYWHKHLPTSLKEELNVTVSYSGWSGLTGQIIAIMNWLYKNDRQLFDDPNVLVLLRGLACRKAGKYWRCNTTYKEDKQESNKLITLATKENNLQLLDLIPFSQLLREVASGSDFVCDYLLERAKDKGWASEYYGLYGNNILEELERSFSPKEMQALEPVIQTIMRSVVRQFREELTEKVTRPELLKRLARHSELLTDIKPIDTKLGSSLMREMTKILRVYDQDEHILEYNLAERTHLLIRYLSGNKDFPSIAQDEIVKLVTSGVSVTKLAQCKTPADIKAMFKLTPKQRHVLKICKESVIIPIDSDFYRENERTLDFLLKHKLIDEYGESNYVSIPDEYRKEQIPPLIAVSHKLKGKRDLVVEDLSEPKKAKLLEILIDKSDELQLDRAIQFLKVDERHLQANFDKMTEHEAINYGILTEALTDGFHEATQQLTTEWRSVKKFLESVYPYSVIIPEEEKSTYTITLGKLVLQQDFLVYVPHELAGKRYLMKVWFTISKDKIVVTCNYEKWIYKVSQSQSLEDVGLKNNLHESFMESADGIFFDLQILGS